MELKGDANNFLHHKKQIGFPSYTFHELCLLMGYKDAFNRAKSYALSVRADFHNSPLVVDFINTLHDGYAHMVGDQRIITDTQGIIVGVELKYREYEAYIRSKSPDIKITHKKTILEIEDYAIKNQIASLSGIVQSISAGRIQEGQ